MMRKTIGLKGDRLDLSVELDGTDVTATLDYDLSVPKEVTTTSSEKIEFGYYGGAEPGSNLFLVCVIKECLPDLQARRDELADYLKKLDGVIDELKEALADLEKGASKDDND